MDEGSAILEIGGETFTKTSPARLLRHFAEALRPAVTLGPLVPIRRQLHDYATPVARTPYVTNYLLQVDLPSHQIKGRDLPGVIRVFDNNPLTFLGAQSPVYDAPVFRDCVANPKVSMGEVCQYLGINDLRAQSGLTGRGITVAIVDNGMSHGFRPELPFTRLRPSSQGVWPTHADVMALNVAAIAPDAQLIDVGLTSSSPIARCMDAVVAYEHLIAYYLEELAPRGYPLIATNSWGIADPDSAPDYATDHDNPLVAVVREAVALGIVVLFSAGNCGQECAVPLLCNLHQGRGDSIWGVNGIPEVITVGAATIGEDLLGSSSQGPSSLGAGCIKPDFCAPSFFLNNGIRCEHTSSATSIAAGVTAVVMQASPITPSGMAETLRDTATGMGHPVPNADAGYGMVNPVAAVRSLLNA